MDSCPCGSEKDYESCCGPYHSGESVAPTAEALMRSRYSAYAKMKINYLGETLVRAERRVFDKKATEKWAKLSSWQGLEIKDTEAGGEDDDEGIVEFIARYKMNNKEHVIHERSRFRKNKGRWFYVCGDILEES